MRESGRALVDKLDIKKGMKVLDLGCGDGSTALPEALLGADVTGIDIARNLVEAGNRRVKEAGLTNCVFRHGDAMDLQGVADQSFDRLVTIFGAMFAPRPDDAAREMVRVTRKGGKIFMGNWIPGDPTLVAQILRISSAYLPPPPEGFVSPMLWGKEEQVTARFVKAGIPAEGITFRRENFPFVADFPPTEFLRLFRDFYGPTMNAFEAATKDGRDNQLRGELEDLFESQNNSDDPAKTKIDATFLLVTVQC